MSKRVAKSILLLFLSIYFPIRSFSQDIQRSAGPDSIETTGGISLMPGRPDYLQAVKFFQDPTVFRSALFVDAARDSVVFVVKDLPSANPQCWLLGIQSGTIVATKELVFDSSRAGLLVSVGELLWSDKPSASFEIRYAPSEHRVWCNWGGDHSTGSSARSGFLTFGLRWESVVIVGTNLNYGRASSSISPSSVAVVPTIAILPTLALEFRIGATLPTSDEGFGGLDIAAFLRGAPLQDQFYFLAGLTWYHLSGYEQGMSYHVSLFEGQYLFYCIGAGVQISPHVIADLAYLLPQEKTFGQVDLYQGSTWITPAYTKTINGMLKAGICFYL